MPRRAALLAAAAHRLVAVVNDARRRPMWRRGRRM